MQDSWDAEKDEEHERCRTGGMQDRGMKDRMDTIIQDRWDVGQEGCRAWDVGQEGCRIGGMQDRWDVGQEGCMTGRM